MSYIIAIDFDGTLCENKWPEIGEPKQYVIDIIIKCRNEGGAKLILWTCRNGKELKDAIKWSTEHGITYDAINENLPSIRKKFGGDSRKIFANFYVDDRNLAPDECFLLPMIDKRSIKKEK